MAKNKYLSFTAHRRFSKVENPEELYEYAYRVLSELPPPWGLEGVPFKKMPNYVGQPSVGISYTRQEKGSPISSFHFGYMNRDRSDNPADEPSYDDRLSVDFYPQKVKEPWKYLAEVVLPAYIRAMKPYLVKLCEPNLYVSDMGVPNFDTGEFYSNPNFVDLRHGVYRIWPVNYWDAELCNRAFKMTPKEIVKRLSSSVAECRPFENGVIVIFSNEEVPIDDIPNINERLMPLLKIKGGN